MGQYTSTAKNDEIESLKRSVSTLEEEKASIEKRRKTCEDQAIAQLAECRDIHHFR